MIVGHLCPERVLFLMALSTEEKFVAIFAFVTLFINGFSARKTLKFVFVMGLLAENSLHFVVFLMDF